MKDPITIIIPLYNEEENLAITAKTLMAFIDSSPLKCRLLFVDDGSTDAGAAILEPLVNNREDIQLIRLDRNYGLSTALRAGFEHARTAWVGYIDADLQTHPSDFNKLFPFMQNFDLITGIRAQRNDPYLKRKASNFANWFRRLFTKDGISDTGCPLKLMRRSYALGALNFRGMHRFLPALVQLQGGTVKQVPVDHFPRLAGSSKFNMLNRSIGPLLDCFVFLWMRKRIIRYGLDQGPGG